jgi:putative ABC transport system permease protein
MEIRPILSSMIRNRTGAVLVALQIAVTLAVLCNAGFIVQQRLEKMDRPTGYDDQNIVTIQSIAVDEDDNSLSQIAEARRAVAAIPGVVAVSVTPQLPLTNSGIGWSMSRTGEPNDPDSVNVSLLVSDAQALDAFGMKLVAGRWFRAEEIQAAAGFEQLVQLPLSVVVLTQSVAERLFPDGNAVGQTVYDFPGRAMQVIGVVERAQGYFVSSATAGDTVFWPVLMDGFEQQFFVVRTRPGERDAVAGELEAALTAGNPRRLVQQLRGLDEILAGSYSSDRAMTITLLTVMGLLVAVTVLGLFGLMSFNVSRRRKQIGTRRALGARRGDIVRHFLVESWLVTSLGAAAGVVLAVALSVWLVNAFELPRLDWRYIPAGIIMLWVVGQVAAVAPARKAAAIEPAVATRSV